MKIGYAKIGRSMPLTPDSFGIVGGDDEPPFLLRTLAERNPQHEFVILGRNTGENAQAAGFPSNVTNAWEGMREEAAAAHKALGKDPSADAVVKMLDGFTRELFVECDGHVVWAGQHGTSNSPIPKVKTDDVTAPQISFVNYASYVVRGINAWRDEDPTGREEVWLHPDPRNYLKCRDLKWPLRSPMLGQYNFSKQEKHHRYDDMRDPGPLGFDAEWDEFHKIWVAQHRYTYSRLEICGVMPELIDSEFSQDLDRGRFGLFINEARAYVAKNRKDALRDFVLPLDPQWIHGKWTDASLEELGLDIHPASIADYYPTLRSVRSTFTTPSSGSGWATTKPWQAFAVGTVCFFHPAYDDQGHIIPTKVQALTQGYASKTLATLGNFLRVSTPEELEEKVERIENDDDLFLEVIGRQRRYYDWACEQSWHLGLIEGRLGL